MVLIFFCKFIAPGNLVYAIIEGIVNLNKTNIIIDILGDGGKNHEKARYCLKIRTNSYDPA